MEELLRRLYAAKDARVEKFKIAYQHDARVREACHDEWDVVEEVTLALKKLERAEKITDNIYANP